MASLPSPQPGTLLDLATQLHRDDAEPLDKLRRRDRAIGQQMGLDESLSSKNIAERAGRLTAWLNALDEAPHRASDGLRWVGLIAVGLGLLLGYGAAMGLFYYDGSTPVNVVGVLAVFVGLQAVTLVLLLTAALPGAGGIPGALRDLSPARLATLVARWLPGETRDAVQQILGRGLAHQRVYHAVQKWQLLSWSQAMALAFNLAAVGGAMQLIVFSDLAFGWSTTLDMDADEIHRIVESLGGAWSWLWPEAVPSLSVVEVTQNFRAQDFVLDDVEVGESAKWWPFLVMAMLVYGVLPRVVTVIATRWFLKRSVVRAMATTPGADRVLERMTTVVVETRATEHEVAGNEERGVSRSEAASSEVGCVIRWADAAYDGEALDAGGGRSLEEDRQTIAVAAEGSDRPVLIRVKAWEPPVLELLDFLGDLRRSIGDGRAIEVQPIGEGDRVVWKKKLASVGDSWLRMVQDDPPPMEGVTP